MEVLDFAEMIEQARVDLRWLLKGYTFGESAMGFKKMIKKYLDKCCSSFEEETLKENLQEEFKECLLNVTNQGE